MRYVLLDRITALDPPRSARGVKCVSLSEDVFADHFPVFPVLPGALVVEGMAQLAGTLLEACARLRGKDDLYAVLTEVDRTRFRRLVRPGDRIDFDAEVLHEGELGGRVRVTAAAEGERVTQTELTFALNALRSERLRAHRREQLAVWLRSEAIGVDGEIS